MDAINFWLTQAPLPDVSKDLLYILIISIERQTIYFKLFSCQQTEKPELRFAGCRQLLLTNEEGGYVLYHGY
jgi:hypothetical protein